MAYIATPETYTFSKSSPGTSDVTVSNGVYKFMGCSVLSVSMNLGFNGSASSLSVTLVEDTQAGDAFVNPDTPSLWAFSLPKGGIGMPVIYTSPVDLNPDGFAPTNVPFYFCGICTGWQKSQRDIGGKTISVTLVDPREMFSGIQCLLGGFALSQNVSGSLPRYSNVKNIIDVFGYYDYGMTSGKNEYGMTWSSVQQCLEAVRATVNNIGFEFYFTGTTFSDVPSYYRINEDIIDLNGLIQKVVADAGSDFIVVARKVSSSVCVVEIRGVKRTNFNLLTASELDSFVSVRNDIVESYKKGKEYRNEPTSTVVIGGMRNSNYTAYPSSYDETMHLKLDACPGGSGAYKEHYGSFPTDIKVRLFGGSGITYVEQCADSGVNQVISNFDVRSGAIYPFWGFTPDDYAYPLVEPFLPLDHYAFDKVTNFYANLKNRIPCCKLTTSNFTVRRVVHQDVFLSGDGSSDDRPFAYLQAYLPSGVCPTGYTKGLPLNTEVLRAALSGPEPFFNIYSIYYPDVAESLGFPILDFSKVHDYVTTAIANNQKLDLENFITTLHWEQSSSLTIAQENYALTGNTQIDKAIATQLNNNNQTTFVANALYSFAFELWTLVRTYAEDNMGKRFLVCLPKSQIMNRIWNNLPVPTNIYKPTIEYVVDERGYWEYVPNELDGVVNGGSGTSIFTANQEQQIRRRFMAEDSRFYAMVGIDWAPSGNINFNSNRRNKALFQELPTSEFRPNNIADGNPSYVLCSCSVNQLPKRPDLALLELPTAIHFDPIDNPDEGYNYRYSGNDENIVKKLGIIKYMRHVLGRNNKLRSALVKAANYTTTAFNVYSTRIINAWANNIYNNLHFGFQQENSTEPVMDLKGAIIPLTSTWISYGPWFTTSGNAEGMVRVEVDPALVPWRFTRPTIPLAWDTNLNAAGEEKLARSLSDMYWLDSAVISVAGFPEYGPAQPLGYNSNLTAINVDFGVGGVKTTYNFSTYLKKPGTFRKGDFDNVSRSRIDTREKLLDTVNKNYTYAAVPTGNNPSDFIGTNRFRA